MNFDTKLDKAILKYSGKKVSRIELAKILNTSPATIRQYENQALKKIKEKICKLKH